MVFYVEPDMILSSGAEDILRNRGYAIHHGKRPSTCTTSPKADVRKEIERILEKEYQIDNRNVLNVIVDKILERL